MAPSGQNKIVAQFAGDAFPERQKRPTTMKASVLARVEKVTLENAFPLISKAPSGRLYIKAPFHTFGGVSNCPLDEYLNIRQCRKCFPVAGNSL